MHDAPRGPRIYVTDGHHQYCHCDSLEGSRRNLRDTHQAAHDPRSTANHDTASLLATNMDWDTLTPQRLQVLEQFKRQVQEEKLLENDAQQLVPFDDFTLTSDSRASLPLIRFALGSRSPPSGDLVVSCVLVHSTSRMRIRCSEPALNGDGPSKGKVSRRCTRRWIPLMYVTRSLTHSTC